jgi:hypothetical protein
MAYSFKDYFQTPDSQSRQPAEAPSALPDALKFFPPPKSRNPFGPPPKIQPQQQWFHIWDPLPTAPAPEITPAHTYPILPPATPNPFPDPSIPALPPIPASQPFPAPDPDPSDFPGKGENEPGGLLGMLRAMMLQARSLQDSDSAPAPIITSQYGPEDSAIPQGDLLARIRELQQSQFQPDDNGSPIRYLGRRVEQQ